MVDERTIIGEIVQVMPEPPVELCSWTENADERRRCFVLIQFADLELDELDKICQWLEKGVLPHRIRAVKE
jgi:hypothetical protein